MTVNRTPNQSARLHVVLDRDGVLNREDTGRAMRTWAEWRWEDGALPGLALLARGCHEVSIVTNQSAVSRGEITEHELHQLHHQLAERLLSMGVNLIGIHACPHGPSDGCDCRKPAPGMVQSAVAASSVPVERTVLIGDDLRDLDAAAAAGVRSVLVRTGKGRTVETMVDNSAVDDLSAAVLAVTGIQPAEPSDAIVAIFEEHLGVVGAALALASDNLEAIAERLLSALDDGATVFAAGNGGSAADAQHFIAELIGRFGADRAPMRAIALGTDSVSASAMANDYGYGASLARQLEGLARAGDVLVALSTSGESANVCAAADTAKTLGVTTIALTGADGGRLGRACDVLLAAPSRRTARIQEVHSLYLHSIAKLIDEQR